ncbi:MAG: DUF2237 domain-containing protein [Myxococcota bacterium]|nr:DUF2237 domain-containing protein [Myxococcota bacterium]
MNGDTNVLGGPLASCSTDPMTGWTRDGCCRTDHNDRGSHTVCAQMTAGFLEFSVAQGNDLVTPVPQYQFPGLKPGDRWCLCASRWLDAYKAGKAPLVVLESTNAKALRTVPLEALLERAISVAADA